MGALIEGEDKRIVKGWRIAIRRLAYLHPMHNQLQQLIHKDPLSFLIVPINFVQFPIISLKHVLSRSVKSLQTFPNQPAIRHR